MQNTLRTDRKTGHNSTFAIGGVSCSADSLVVAESVVLRMNICADKPRVRQAENRYSIQSRYICLGYAVSPTNDADYSNMAANKQ
jgi:hypothetical protein